MWDILCTSTLDNVPIGYAGNSSLKSFLKFWENIVYAGFLLVNWKLQACNFTKDRIILDVFWRIILSFSEKLFITTHLNGCSLSFPKPPPTKIFWMRNSITNSCYIFECFKNISSSLYIYLHFFDADQAKKCFISDNNDLKVHSQVWDNFWQLKALFISP